MKYYVRVDGGEHEVEVRERAGELQVTFDGRPVEVAWQEVDRLGQVAMVVDGRSWAVSIEGDENAADVVVAGRAFRVELEDERERAAHAAEREGEAKGGVVKSVMPGVVVSVLVEEGQEVAEGESLVVLEAMKMQNEIAAPSAARVKAVHVTEGAAVGSGTKLVTLE